MTPADLLPRCRFPAPGTALTCAFSGGADSTALLVLAVAAGCTVIAHHVDHRLRATSATEADQAAAIAREIGVPFELTAVTVAPGPNLEARARAARRAVLPPGHATGHTADDQAETLLINLLRGTGLDGLTGMRPGPAHPLLALRRHETRTLCLAAGIAPVADPSNADRRFVRNRVRAEVLPLLDDIAGRDVTALLARTSDSLRDDAGLLARLLRDSGNEALDPADARAVAAADPAVARRALRGWIAAATTGYPPSHHALDRAYEVALGTHRACELPGGFRVERTAGRLRISGGVQVTSPA